MNKNYHKQSLARSIFEYFSKKYGKGHFSHGHIKNIDFLEQKIDFKGMSLRFCMFMQDYTATYLTVFEESKKNNLSGGRILSLTSCLSFHEDKNTVKEEVQHLYNDALPEDAFIKEVHYLLLRTPYLKELWPLKDLGHLKVA